MFKDFIATLVTTIIALSGAVADSTGHLTEKLGDVLVPVTTTSISYARVPAPPVQTPTGIVRGESTTTPSTSTTVITQPVIERVIETVRTVGSGVSSADLDARLAAFAYDFTNRLQLRSNTSLRQDEILSDSIGERPPRNRHAIAAQPRAQTSYLPPAMAAVLSIERMYVWDARTP